LVEVDMGIVPEKTRLLSLTPLIELIVIAE